MDASVQLTLLGRAALAALLGFAIGMEREYRGKSAGERTFALLALGAAGFTGGGTLLASPNGTSRVIQGVVAGMGFLGAGVIFRRAERGVKGLTTAAGAWAASAIGVLVGLGAYLASVLITLLVLLVLELDQVPVLRRIRDLALQQEGEDQERD